jgi:hypothetical protein
MHITVTDLTTGHSGTIVLDARAATVTDALRRSSSWATLSWGLVNDAPNSLVWEIGHTTTYTTPAGRSAARQRAKPACFSYDDPRGKFSPLQILGDVRRRQHARAGRRQRLRRQGSQPGHGAANYGAPFALPLVRSSGPPTHSRTGDYPARPKTSGRRTSSSRRRTASPMGGFPSASTS